MKTIGTLILILFPLMLRAQTPAEIPQSLPSGKIVLPAVSTPVPSPVSSPKQTVLPLSEPVLEPESHLKEEGTSSATAAPVIPKPESTQPAVPPAVVENPKVTPEGEMEDLSLLRRKWFERQRVLEVADVEVADNLLPSLVSLRLDLGVSDLVAYSHALIRESERAFDQKSYKRAMLLAGYALELSPNTPDFYYFNARMAFRNNPFAVADSISLFGKGIWMQGATLAQALRQLGNLAIYFVFALLLSFCVALILIIFKYANLLTHTLQHVLIVKMPKPVGQVVTLSFLFIPIVLQLGMGWVLLFWGFLFLPYARPAERVFLTLIVVLLIALPYALPLLTGTITARSEPAYQYILAMQNQIDPSSLEKFRLRQQKSDPTGVDAFALGYVYKKRGSYALARKFYEDAMRIGYAPAATLNNLGNVLFASGDPNSAIEMYKKASAAQPDFFESDYNLGQAYYEIKDVRRGTEALASAKDKSSRFMTYYTSIKSANFNRLLADAQISDFEILQFIFAPSPIKEDLSLRYWHWVMRPLEMFSLPFFVLIVAALWIVMLVLVKFLKFPAACSKCSEAACQWCYATSKRTDLCSQCFHVFVRKEGVDPLARESKEREIAEYERWRHRFTRLITIFLPGSGHFFLGKTFRGLLFQLTFMIMLSGIFFWEGAFVSPIPMSFSGSVFKVMFLFVFGGAYYVLILRNIVQE